MAAHGPAAAVRARRAPAERAESSSRAHDDRLRRAGREPDSYRDHAAPGIARAAEADAAVVPFEASGTICSDYNLILDRLRRRDDLEALVLVDEDAEIADPDFCEKVRARAGRSRRRPRRLRRRHRRRRPRVVGRRRSARRRVVHRYGEYGGGELRRLRVGAHRARRPPRSTLSPACCSSCRRGPRARCASTRRCTRHRLRPRLRAAARAPGRKVVTADLRVIHHRSLEVVEEPDLWVEGHIALAEKWDGRLPGAPPRPADWKERARLAEAERDAARARAYSNYSRREAQLLPLQRELEAMTGTLGWRLTEPLRRLNARRRVAEQHATDLVPRDDRLAGRDPGPDPQLRQPLGHRERLRLQHPAQHGLLARRALQRARTPGRCGSTRLASSRSSTALRSHGSRIARRARPTTARQDARPRRSRRTPGRRRAAGARGRRRSPRPR